MMRLVSSGPVEFYGWNLMEDNREGSYNNRDES